MNYNQAVEKFSQIKNGMSSEDVLGLMGEPQSKVDSSWQYDFSSLEGFPKIEPGAQVFFDGSVTFSATGIVNGTNLGWVDSTGPAPSN